MRLYYSGYYDFGTMVENAISLAAEIEYLYVYLNNIDTLSHLLEGTTVFDEICMSYS